jgi:hypothetical protein
MILFEKEISDLNEAVLFPSKAYYAKGKIEDRPLGSLCVQNMNIYSVIQLRDQEKNQGRYNKTKNRCITY